MLSSQQDDNMKIVVYTFFFRCNKLCNIFTAISAIIVACSGATEDVNGNLSMHFPGAAEGSVSHPKRH